MTDASRDAATDNPELPKLWADAFGGLGRFR